MSLVIHAMNTQMRSTVSYMRPYLYAGNALLWLGGMRAVNGLYYMRGKKNHYVRGASPQFRFPEDDHAPMPIHRPPI